MRLINNIPDELLRTIDTLNTLNGGISQAAVKSEKFKDHLEFRVKVPGTDLEDLTVEHRGGQLLILNNIPNGDDDPIVRVIAVIPVFSFIDYHSIKSFYQNRELVIDMPFNEMADGYSRDIDILPIS